MTTYWVYEHDLEDNITRSMGDEHPTLAHAVDAAMSLGEAREPRVQRVIDNDTNSTVWLAGPLAYMESYFQAQGYVSTVSHKVSELPF